VGRFETLLAAKIIPADPRAAEDQAKIWEAERFVRAGRSGQSGLKLLIATANAGDVIWFLATLNRTAEILWLNADLDSADLRRSKAIGILAQPALALQLLWMFRTQTTPQRLMGPRRLALAITTPELQPPHQRRNPKPQQRTLRTPHLEGGSTRAPTRHQSWIVRPSVYLPEHLCRRRA
jgi:hypothetical protein